MKINLKEQFACNKMYYKNMNRKSQIKKNP